MSTQCHACGTSPAESRCARCKNVHYCSRACQKSDWTTHKKTCKLYEGEPCDECKIADYTLRPITNCCFACGYLFCDECGEKYIERNGPRGGNPTGFKPCPGCGGANALHFGMPENFALLQKLCDEKIDDPRRPVWLLGLGGNYRDAGAPFDKVKACFVQAGDLGLGEGYSRAAELYVPRQDWVQVKNYYEKAAARNHVVALHCLAVEAMLGYFDFGYATQTVNRSRPNPERAYRFMKLAAQLDYPPACSGLAKLYEDGIGCQVSEKEHLKWARRGAEKGDVLGMKMLGIDYKYGFGDLEQDLEQAKFWLKKAADKGDMDALRSLQEFNLM